MDEQRKYAVLFSAIILAARKLTELGDKPSPSTGGVHCERNHQRRANPPKNRSTLTVNHIRKACCALEYEKMKIDIRDPGEFKCLLEALVGDLIDARDHFKLHQSLAAAIPDYQVEFNQSAGFWTLTLNAHMDAVLLRLCKAYDLSKDKPNLNLKNFLDTIEANLYLFNEPNFRERLKGNPFVDSLAQDPRTPDESQLQEDLKLVSAADPLVKKLTNWRHHYVAHRSRTAALNPQLFATQNPLLFSEIETLIANGFGIVNCYSSLFSATVHTSLPTKDYQYLLDAVRRDLEMREAQIQKDYAAMNATSGNDSQCVPGKP